MRATSTAWPCPTPEYRTRYSRRPGRRSWAKFPSRGRATAGSASCRAASCATAAAGCGCRPTWSRRGGASSLPALPAQPAGDPGEVPGERQGPRQEAGGRGVGVSWSGYSPTSADGRRRAAADRGGTFQALRGATPSRRCGRCADSRGTSKGGESASRMRTSLARSPWPSFAAGSTTGRGERGRAAGDGPLREPGRGCVSWWPTGTSWESVRTPGTASSKSIPTC
jgi:hypothetical protein